MNKTMRTIVAFMAVGAAGALTGILLAPDEGSKTGKKLLKKGKKLLRQTKNTAEDLVAKATGIKDNAIKEGENIIG